MMDSTYPQSELGVSLTTREDIQKLLNRCTNEVQQEHTRHRHRLALIDRRITDLRFRLNATTPIARLPSETLALVFEAYADALWHDFISNQPSICVDDDIVEEIYEAMLAILHVCRHWRNVALSTHRLWTRIIPESQPLVELAISQSGCIPLVIGLANSILEELKRGCYDYLNVEAYASIFPELRRIRTLRLPVTSNMEKTMDMILKSQLVDAPLLEKLEVLFFQGVKRLPYLSTLALPKLRQLSLSMAPFSIVRTMVGPTLTHLRLSGKICERDLLPFLEVLDKLSNIEDLFLSWTEDVREDHNLVAPQPVLMPRLQKLTLEDPQTGWNGLKILEHCIFPATTIISFTVKRMINRSSMIYPPLAQKLLVPDRKDAPPFLPQSMRISDTGFCFEMWPSVIPGTPYGSADNDFDLLEAQYLVRINPLDRWLGPNHHGHLSSMRFFTSLNVGSSLVSLCIRTRSIYGGPTSDWWIATLSGMTRLETLRIKAQRAVETKGFLEAFGTGRYSGATEQTLSYLCPQLKSLEILIELPLDEDDDDDVDDNMSWAKAFEVPWDFPSQAIQHLGTRQRKGPRLPLLKILFKVDDVEDTKALSQAAIADRREIIILPRLRTYIAKPTRRNPMGHWIDL